MSVMDIAKRMLVEALKLFNGEISRFSKNYEVDKLLDPNAKLTNIQGDQLSEHSFLDEDRHQETSEQKVDQTEEEELLNNIAPATPTGQGVSKHLTTSRSSHPTRDCWHHCWKTERSIYQQRHQSTHCFNLSVARS